MSRKNIMIAAFSLLILASVSAKAFGADVTGVWRYEGLPGSEVTIAQDGRSLYVCAHHGVDGSDSSPASVISYGIGEINGDRIKIKFKVVRRPTPTWGGSNGVTDEDLTVSADGRTITGTWHNDGGSGVAAKLVRVH